MRVGDWLSCVGGQGGDERDDQYNRGEGRRLDDSPRKPEAEAVVGEQGREHALDGGVCRVWKEGGEE